MIAPFSFCTSIIYSNVSLPQATHINFIKLSKTLDCKVTLPFIMKTNNTLLIGDIMKINEIETLLGLSRANIRFYEKEGLLNPPRNGNGYRDYTEEDIVILKKIIIFRKLGLSLPDIKDILTGNLDLSIAMEKNIQSLTEQIESLNGALEISNALKKNATTNETFDEEYYWSLIHSKENAGEKFADILKDYLELEKRSLLTMFKNVFFIDLNEKANSGWKILLLSILTICVLRGLGREFLWNGSFWDGFSYPFILFGTISLIILPIFYLHKKYQDTPPEETPPSRHPKLITALKWIGGLAYFITYLFFIPIIAEDLFTSLNDNITYLAAYKFYFIYWITGLFVLVLWIYLYSTIGLLPDRITGESSIKSNIPKKEKRKIAFFSVILLFLSLIPSCGFYDCFTEDKLIISRIVYTKEYTWDEIDYYTLSEDSGTLTFTVVMNDGAKYDCIGGQAMAWTSNLPEDKYPDQDYDFVRYLTRIYTDMGIELRIDNWNKLYKDLDYDVWIELAKDIREISGN